MIFFKLLLIVQKPGVPLRVEPVLNQSYAVDELTCYDDVKYGHELITNYMAGTLLAYKSVIAEAARPLATLAVTELSYSTTIDLDNVKVSAW